MSVKTMWSAGLICAVLGLSGCAREVLVGEGQGPVRVEGWEFDVQVQPYTERTQLFVNGLKVADEYWPFFRDEYSLKGFYGSKPVEAQCFRVGYMLSDDYVVCNLMLGDRRMAVVRR